jgi:DNA processing protein
VIYLRGDLPRGPAVGIVGTRHPTADATRFARELAADLGRAGVAVFSGGAEGIDTAAHQGALDAGACGVVVAPGGFDRPCPERNAALFRQVVESGGAYLSLVPSGTPANRGSYFPRNAVLVALCHAIVVVECPVRSGARNTAAAARRLNRPVFVVPAVPWNYRGAGCVIELQRGGRALFSHRDVLRFFEQARLHAVAPVTDQLSLPLESGSVSDRVIAAIRAGATHADAICAATGLDPAPVQQALLELLLLGTIGRDFTGRLRA